jgi:hypothetical protein
MTHAHRVVLKGARLVHVYLTLFGCCLILFFAATGFMLNHEDWFLPEDQEPYVSTAEGSVPTALLKPVDRLAVVELLRKDFGATGAVNDFDDKDEDQPIRVQFKAPGREAEALIQRDSGKTEVTHRARGLLAVLTDLHKGKDAGAAWKLLIDAVCVLLVVVSATGLVLWQSLRGRGKYGLVFLAGGLSLAVGVYYCFVP